MPGIPQHRIPLRIELAPALMTRLQQIQKAEKLAPPLLAARFVAECVQEYRADQELFVLSLPIVHAAELRKAASELGIAVKDLMRENNEAYSAERRRLLPLSETRLWRGQPVIKPSEKNGRSRLTEEDIQTIRELRAEGMRSPAIARRFKVSPTTVRRYFTDD